MYKINFFFFSFADYPVEYQFLFQDPATPIMEGIIDLHHHIFFFLILIVVFVSWLVLSIIVRYWVSYWSFRPYTYVNFSLWLKFFFVFCIEFIFLINKTFLSILFSILLKLKENGNVIFFFQQLFYYFNFYCLSICSLFLKVLYFPIFLNHFVFNKVNFFLIKWIEIKRSSFIYTGNLILFDLSVALKFLQIKIKGLLEILSFQLNLLYKQSFLINKIFILISFFYNFFFQPFLYKFGSRRAKIYFVSFTRGIAENTAIEIIWTIIPSIILIFIAIPSFILLYSIDEFVSDTTVIAIKVIGNQWYWSYEKGNETSLFSTTFQSYMVDDNDLNVGNLRLLEVDRALVLPAFTHIRFLITSYDVLHSWAIPSLGIKMDAVPGRLNQVMLYIKREGVFYGQCSEICGVNHGFMPIKIKSYFPCFFELFN